ncbi:MAG: hypothetical protein IPH62_19970 [Ignavibacteriae bacterium]|nr:hypothetical protein [Ignavibacteriota bacterium]
MSEAADALIKTGSTLSSTKNLEALTEEEEFEKKFSTTQAKVNAYYAQIKNLIRLRVAGKIVPDGGLGMEQT